MPGDSEGGGGGGRLTGGGGGGKGLRLGGGEGLGLGGGLLRDGGGGERLRGGGRCGCGLHTDVRYTQSAEHRTMALQNKNRASCLWRLWPLRHRMIAHLGNGGGCKRCRGGGTCTGPVWMLDTLAPGYALVNQGAPLFNPAVKFSACPDDPTR